MKNLDALNEMKFGEFVEKFCDLDNRYPNIVPYDRYYYNLCYSMSCKKCPFDKYENCFEQLKKWLNENIDESGLSDAAKMLNYNDLISAYYRCNKLCIGCETGDECPLYDLTDMNCEEIFDYHFSKPDCPFDPRILK